jgi:hypothetical protein
MLDSMNTHLEPALCAYVDVLGFRQKIEKSYSANTQESLFLSLSETFSACGARMKTAEKHLPMLKVKFFSDNLVVAYSVVPFFLSSVVHLCELLADYQLSMVCKEGLFLRGGISLGTLGINDDMIFGDCLLGAHDMEKTTARFPRIIIDSQIANKLAEYNPKLDLTWQSTVKRRLLRDSDGHFFVNYLDALFNKRSANDGVTLIVNEDQLSSHGVQVERHLKEERQRPDVWFKYFWVANYHNHFCDAQNQQNHKIAAELLLPKPV